MRSIPSLVAPGHPDFPVLNIIRTEIFRLAGGPDRLRQAFPGLVQGAMEFVLDPVHTGRTQLQLLDNVEKTFVGLKAEHYFRDFLDVPKGLRDLVIAGMDVDVKNTVRSNWMIPQETYTVSGACVLVSYDDELRQCSLGLFLARPEYLNAPNQDKKRSLARKAFENILWLVESASFPESHWAPFDMVRFRELRKVGAGMSVVRTIGTVEGVI
jgi:hypothetical protein